MRDQIYLIFDNLWHECITEKEARQEVLNLLPSIERFDAEKWLQEKKDIWDHPIITDRTNKRSYEVADLMAEFANHFFYKK